MITSAALYFQSQTDGSVPLRWVEQVCQFFASCDIPFDSFALWAPGFSEEHAYDLTEHKPKLIEALTKHGVSRITFYSGLVCDQAGERWRGMASCAMTVGGGIFVGIEETVIAELALLLRRVLNLSQTLPRITYGIGYRYPLSKAPYVYAVGGIYTSLREALAWDEEKVRLAAWQKETLGEKRYLKGFFRGAYPANILSGEHIQSLRLIRFESWGLGTLTPLESGLWLWELSDQEIPKVEDILRSNGLLIQ